MTVAMPALDALNEIERKWVTALYEVANNNPEFEYPRESENPEWWVANGNGNASVCRYFLANGTPACVWGNVFSKLEIPAESVPENKSIYEVLARIDTKQDINPIIVGLFSDFQADQDYGRNWGYCLKHFDNGLRGWLYYRDPLRAKLAG